MMFTHWTATTRLVVKLLNDSELLRKALTGALEENGEIKKETQGYSNGSRQGVDEQVPERDICCLNTKPTEERK